MAHFNNQGRLSRKAFAKAPAILENLDDIEPSDSSLLDSNNSEASSDCLDDIKLIKVDPSIPISEPCLVTGSVLHTNKPTHWIRSRDNEAAKNDTEDHIRKLKIHGVDFLLDSPANISNLDCFVQESMETYAFVAVTGTCETLLQLIELLKKDCQRRQAHFDEQGDDPDRIIDYDNPGLRNAKYELVVLHPEQFLPHGAFTMFDKDTGTFKTYVLSSDRRLREMPGTLTCPPPPSLSPRSGIVGNLLSPFLVALNAGVKFRRYKRQAERNPPTKPLPDDVLALMDLTIQLIDLIYWEPDVKEDTPGGKLAIERRGKDYSRWYRHKVVDPGPEGANLETRTTHAMRYKRRLGDDPWYRKEDELLFGDDPWYRNEDKFPWYRKGKAKAKAKKKSRKNPGEDNPDSGKHPKLAK